MKPYTYLVTHKASNKRYYGCSYGKNCHPDNLGKTYLTSSKIINNIIKTEGIDAFIWEVRLLRNTPNEVRLLEAKFLSRINAAESDDWFNRSNGSKNFLCIGHSDETRKKMVASHTGMRHSEETKRKISEGNKGKIMPPISDETRRKQSISRTGLHRTEDTRKRISESKMGKNNPRFGVPITDETRKRLSDAQTGQNNGFFGKSHSEDTRREISLKMLSAPRMTCKFCGIVVSKSMHDRWHGEKCKHKSNHSILPETI